MLVSGWQLTAPIEALAALRTQFSAIQLRFKNLETENKLAETAHALGDHEGLALTRQREVEEAQQSMQEAIRAARQLLKPGDGGKPSSPQPVEDEGVAGKADAPLPGSDESLPTDAETAGLLAKLFDVRFGLTKESPPLCMWLRDVVATP